MGPTGKKYREKGAQSVAFNADALASFAKTRYTNRTDTNMSLRGRLEYGLQVQDGAGPRHQARQLHLPQRQLLHQLCYGADGRSPLYRVTPPSGNAMRAGRRRLSFFCRKSQVFPAGNLILRWIRRNIPAVFSACGTAPCRGRRGSGHGAGLCAGGHE